MKKPSKKAIKRRDNSVKWLMNHREGVAWDGDVFIVTASADGSGDADFEIFGPMQIAG